MKIVILLILSLIILQSCSIKEQHTRIEKDKYTHTIKDSTERHYYSNSPRNKEDGVVNPSTRDIIVDNTVSQYDSIVEREYPDFIRLGLFESVGIFGGDSKVGLDGGIFGVYLDPTKNLKNDFRGTESSLFTGGIYRLGIMEKRLRWFQDSENWTWGFTGMELIMPDAHIENGLMGFGVFNLTKRFYFKTDIPYFALGARFGMGVFPSQYGKLEGFAELGSIGGLNLRAYLGFAAGMNMETTVLINSNDFANEATYPTTFYGGFGVSYFDFINVVPETYREWKDMEHSAWRVGVAEVAVLNSNAESSFFSNESDSTSSNSIIRGGYLKLLNANISLPILDERLYIGTSLLNVMFLGGISGGIGIIPIRVGWMQQILKDELFVDPFIEYNYYPSRFYNIGAKITLGFPRTGKFNGSLILGYASGDPIGGIDVGLGGASGVLEDLTKFSNFYIGIEIGLYEKIFQSKDLKHNR